MSLPIPHRPSDEFYPNWADIASDSDELPNTCPTLVRQDANLFIREETPRETPSEDTPI